MSERKNGLTFGARFALFVVSYLPMFGIMIFRQLYTYRDYLNFGGLKKQYTLNFLKYFGAVSFLCVISIIGVLGLWVLLNNLERRVADNGMLIKIVDIENKNSETMAYLFTYVIPFIFQDLSSLTDVISILVLLSVTFLIYRNSALILINPTISMWYSLYMVEYQNEGANNEKTTRKGMLITKEAFLEEDDKALVKKIGHKLFYAKPKKEN